MGHPLSKLCRTLLGSLCVGAVGWGALATNAIAAQGECSPPQAGEFLILVINPEEDEQEAVAELIPPDRNAAICNYLGEIVTRVGGYTQQQEANGLAQTIAAQTGLGAFVTRPPSVEAPVETSTTVEPPSVPIPESPAPIVSAPPETASEPSPLGIPLIPGRAIEFQSAGDRQNSAPNLPSSTISEEPESPVNPGTLPDLGLGSEPASPEESSIPESPAYNPPPQVSPTAETAAAPATPEAAIPPVRSTPERPQPELEELPDLSPAIEEATEMPETSIVSASAPAFDPQPLEAGYAILVDYNEQPEIAAQLQQAVGNNIGLVSYGQRPYLLVVHTQDQTSANSTLQTLSSSGFLTMMVDSRQVILLAPKVTQF